MKDKSSFTKIAKNSTFSLFLMMILLIILYLPILPDFPEPDDGGEFAVVVNNLAIAHAPGYPTFTVLTRFLGFLGLNSLPVFAKNILPFQFALPSFMALISTVSMAFSMILIIYFLKPSERASTLGSARQFGPSGTAEPAGPSGVAESAVPSLITEPAGPMESGRYWPYLPLILPLYASYPILREATRIEVYSVFLAFLALAICIFKKAFFCSASRKDNAILGAWHLNGEKNIMASTDFFQPNYLFLGFFVMGLATGAHITAVIYTIFLAFSLIFIDFASIRAKFWRMLLFSLISFALGASIYLYLPIRAKNKPFPNWGDPNNFSSVLAHITGKEKNVGAGLFKMESSLVARQLFDLALLTGKKLDPVNVAFSIAGFFLAIKRKAHYMILPFALGLGCVFFNANISKPPSQRIHFYLPYFWTLGVFSAYFSIFLLDEFFVGGQKKGNNREFISFGKKGINWKNGNFRIIEKYGAFGKNGIFGAYGLYGLLIMLFAMNFYNGFVQDSSRMAGADARIYADGVLNSLPENGVFLLEGDDLYFPLIFVQEYLGQRPDLLIIPRSLLRADWYWEYILEKVSPEMENREILLKENKEKRLSAIFRYFANANTSAKRPIFSDKPVEMAGLFSSYNWQIHGMIYEYQPFDPAQANWKKKEDFPNFSQFLTQNKGILKIQNHSPLFKRIVDHLMIYALRASAFGFNSSSLLAVDLLKNIVLFDDNLKQGELLIHQNIAVEREIAEKVLEFEKHKKIEDAYFIYHGYCQLERYDKALEYAYFIGDLEFSENDLYPLANALFNLKQLELAKVIALNQEELWAYGLLAQIYLIEENFDKARKYGQAYLENIKKIYIPVSVDGIIIIAKAEQLKKQGFGENTLDNFVYEKEEEKKDKAILQGAYLVLASAYMGLGKLDMAQDLLLSATSKALPNSAEICQALAQIQLKNGDIKMAIKEWERALTLEGDKNQAVEALIRYRGFAYKPGD